MIEKSWRATFKGHDIGVTNDWVKGARLFVDGHQVDSATQVIVWSWSEVLSGPLNPARPDDDEVTVQLRGRWAVRVRIFVDGVRVEEHRARRRLVGPRAAGSA